MFENIILDMRPGDIEGIMSQDMAVCPRFINASLTIPENSQAIKICMPYPLANFWIDQAIL